MYVALAADEIEAGDALADFAERTWSWYLFTGIATVLFGFVVLSFRFATILALAIFIGLFFLAVGLVQIFAAFRGMRTRWMYLVAGVISLGAGVVTLVWPDITLFVLAILIGWTLLMWGLADIVGSLTHRQIHFWWLILIRGIISIALGVWAVVHPGLTLVVLVSVIGIWAVVFGALEIIAAFEMRHARKRWDALKASSGAS